MYTGYLLFVDLEWISFALSQAATKRVGFCVGPATVLEIDGNPVFIVDELKRELILLHGRAIDFDHLSPSQAWNRFAETSGYQSEKALTSYLLSRFPGLDVTSKFGFAWLSQLITISPPLPLCAAQVNTSSQDRIQELSVEEVLRIFSLLPTASRTDWTERIVSRKNSI
jgi:hypothetical protein